MGRVQLLGRRDGVADSAEVQRALEKLAQAAARGAEIASPVSQDDNPGELRRSFGTDSEPGRAVVYSTDPKITFVDLGTRDTPAIPVLRGAALDAAKAAAR